jgi:tripartite-type tricarboxylate transporter receptor subunit TctC
MHIGTRILGAVTGLALLAGLGAAHADSPPVRYLLHVSPGGATDVMARKLADVLQKTTGQTYVVENRPGGRGASQMAELTRAAPDGTTIGAVTNTHIAAFHQTLRQYNVDSVDWIAKLVYEPYVYVVRNDSPIRSMQDLADAIKTAPSKMVVAGFVRGSGSHIAWEMFMQAERLPSTSINWVPYDSVGDGVTAVLGGHGAVTIAYVDLVKDYVTAGQLRVIGVMAHKRLEEMKDVPTLEEQGVDVATSWEQWRGVIGPKNMPAAVKQKLADQIEAAMKTPELQEYIHTSSLVADFMGPEAFTQFAKKQDAVTVAWLKRLGMLK